MLESGEPLTRERWLRRNYVFDDVPDQIPPEVEDMMQNPFGGKIRAEKSQTRAAA